MLECFETIDSNDEADENAKPLLLLFKRLVDNKPEQNTVLSNQEICKILKDDFDINVDELHELEVDIYLNTIKKFLKEWPQWQEFDITISRLRIKKDKAGIEQLLKIKTKQLKEYIKTMLKIASSMAKEAVEEVELRKEIKKHEKSIRNSNQTSKDEDVVLEISCTRSQLNKLILNHPGRESVFNIEDETVPSTISLSSVSMQTILNWWCFNLFINFPSFCYRRETTHELKHVLVNKKLKQTTKWGELDTCLQEKAIAKTTDISKKQLYKCLEVISKSLQNSSKSRIFEIAVKLIKQDLLYSPDELKIHSMYRRYMNKYPYVRYLYSDVKVEDTSDEAKKYDLQLEETINPMYQLQLMKVESMKAKETVSVIYIECGMCNLKFNGEQLMDLHQHFIGFHQKEPDWFCTFCHEKFSMIELAENRWYHNCS